MAKKAAQNQTPAPVKRDSVLKMDSEIIAIRAISQEAVAALRPEGNGPVETLIEQLEERAVGLACEVSEITDALKAADSEVLEKDEENEKLTGKLAIAEERLESQTEELDELREDTAGTEALLQGCQPIRTYSVNPLDDIMLEAFNEVLEQVGTVGLTCILNRLKEKRYRSIVAAADLL